MEIPSNRYEFELDALLKAIHLRFEVREIPISTLYLDDNRGSHFNPVLDSMRIYFVLTRFSLVAIITAVAVSQILARLVAMSFNYLAVRNAVFLSDRDHSRALPRYVALVAAIGFASYLLLTAMREQMGIPTVYAKLIAEGLLFLANFTFQRDVVFRKDDDRSDSRKTDWHSYYRSVLPAARLTRRYTTRCLLNAFRRFLPPATQHGLHFMEIGGANSCFFEPIVAELHPRRYLVVDTNEFGLNLLMQRAVGGGVLELRHADALELTSVENHDAVFSVGLIEHFDPEGTSRPIRAHLRNVRPGGILLLTFPTPTWLYRASRSACEAAGIWRFHDERPLERQEILNAVNQDALLLYEKTLWPLFFTQHLMVFRRPDLPSGAHSGSATIDLHASS